ncbi:hypothetical protein JXM83_02450 [Candidatus Woesearchaeota archaeon]|nr:hypothetical protein [Candidatus Woesearchaeota archaeon]
MDIIFQSGDFYNETNSILSNLMTIISALLGAIISGLIAIYIFNKGLKNEKEKKRNENIIESNDLEQYFFHNVDSINFFIIKQIDEIAKCSQRIRDWNNKDFSLSIFPELTTKDIWEINQEKLYKIFVTEREGEIREKANDFINVRNCFYNIDNFIALQTESNKEIFQRLIVNIEIWNENLKTLLSLSNAFVINYNSNPNKGKDDFLKLYTSLMVDKQRELILEKKNENMETVFNELIVPLKLYLKNNKQSSDIRIHMISEPIMNIQKAFYEIKNLRKERRKKVLNSGRNLIRVKMLLNESVLSTKNRNKKIDG